MNEREQFEKWIAPIESHIGIGSSVKERMFLAWQAKAQQPAQEPVAKPLGYVIATRPELLWGGNNSSLIFREYDGHLIPLYTTPPTEAARIAELKAKLAECEKDAKRYRWIKSKKLGNGFNFAGEQGIGRFEIKQKTHKGEATYYEGEGLDHAIDKEIADKG